MRSAHTLEGRSANKRHSKSLSPLDKPWWQQRFSLSQSFAVDFIEAMTKALGICSAFRLSRTPAHIGGLINRGAACYAEDNEYVPGELLGHSTSDIRGLEAEGVI